MPISFHPATSLKRASVWLLFGLLSIAGQATGKPFGLDCTNHFAHGMAPVIIKEQLSARTMRLCYSGFAVLHSGVSRTPLWSAEHLHATWLAQAATVKRKNAYHEEKWLPFWQRAELDDYVRSGYDRGHLSPAGDMPTAQAQYESFSLANIVPQHPKNNQIVWEGIEYSVRELVFQRGELYVITGPLLEGASLKRLNGRVLVPSHIFKAVYDPAAGEAGAYVAPNDGGRRYETVTISALEQRLGINLFPRLDSRIKTAGMRLPRPQPYEYRKRGKTFPAEKKDGARR